jgi:uncharacterized protein (UPF0335 family)
MAKTPTQELSPQAKAYADKQRAAKPMKEDPADKETRENTFRVTADELIGFIERQERLIAEMTDLRDDRKEVQKEAKGRGYNVGVINQIIKLRAMDKAGHAKRRSNAEDLELYMSATGMDL